MNWNDVPGAAERLRQRAGNGYATGDTTIVLAALQEAQAAIRALVKAGEEGDWYNDSALKLPAVIAALKVKP